MASRLGAVPNPKIAVVPPLEDIERAVVEGGGTISDAEQADGIVWVDPRDPEGLRKILKGSPARWVQLPFAGIERFVSSRVIGPDRIWTCTKGVYGPATAEHALALILAAARSLHRHIRTKSWIPQAELLETRQLAGGTVLVVGTGGIGTALAEMLAPLRARIIAVNRSGTPMPGAERTVPVSDLLDVLPKADWVAIAAPLTPETHGLFDAKAFAAMKPEAWIVNVARGGLVDTDALVEALRSKQVAGAALDVTDPEPLPEDHPLRDMENVIITSHVANTFMMALPELREQVRRNVARFAKGEELEGLIDVEAGY